MERETKVIKTPVDGKTIVLKSWLSAREKRTISSIFTSKATFNAEKKDFDIDASVLNDLQDEQIKNVVISVDENDKEVLELCLNMKAEDFDFVLAEIEKIVNPESAKKK